MEMLNCCRTIGKKDTLLAVDVNDETSPIDPSYNPEFPFGVSCEQNLEHIWQMVGEESNKNGVDGITALRIARLQLLSEQCEGDILINLITTSHDNYLHWCKKENNMASYAAFVFELSQLVRLILDEDFKSESPKYGHEKHLLPDGSERTVLHLAAERNLVSIIEMLLKSNKCAAMATTSPDNLFPLHYALTGNHDKAASMLIACMSSESVRHLFGDDGKMNDHLPVFKFSDVIRHGGMKSTVEAILDCLITPDWPFLPVPNNDKLIEQFSCPESEPSRYLFHYRLLDGDDRGQPGKNNGSINPEFNSNQTKSCLRLISEHFGCNPDEALIRHPVVRMLIRSKWNRFGKFWALIDFFWYALFLVTLSIALLTQSSTTDRRQYITNVDYIRLLCEIFSIAFACGFTISEINEARRCKLYYFRDIFNYFDISGQVLVLLIIPLRFGNHPRVEFAVSAAAYLINFIRITKYATSFGSISIYVKTFGNIITHDITKFALLWFMFILAFSGSVCLALKASESEYSAWMFSEYNSSIYGHVLLQEVTSLLGSGFTRFSDDYQSTYDKIEVPLTVLLLLNMFLCMVVLNNILIGQVGNSFASSLEDAKILYDIERTKAITRLESHMFCFNWCLRSFHYIDSEFLDNSELEDDLLEDWVMLKHEDENVESKKNGIKLMIRERLN